MAIPREKFKTYNNVFDNFTNRLLFKLEAAGYFERIVSTIAIGKEANVFCAIKKDGTYVAVKIYRLEVCDFNKMYYYLSSDPRYLNIKRRKREIIFTWAQREYKNLLKFRAIGIRVPTPIYITNNVLLLEFIGDNGFASRQLRNDLTNMDEFFNKLVDYLKLLNNNNLVHGDLSEFNILNNNGDPVVIDCSQSTSLKDSFYNELWERDIKNISRFFSKNGIDVDIEKLKELIEYKN